MRYCSAGHTTTATRGTAHFFGMSLLLLHAFKPHSRLALSSVFAPANCAAAFSMLSKARTACSAGCLGELISNST